MLLEGYIIKSNNSNNLANIVNKLKPILIPQNLWYIKSNNIFIFNPIDPNIYKTIQDFTVMVDDNTKIFNYIIDLQFDFFSANKLKCHITPYILKNNTYINTLNQNPNNTISNANIFYNDNINIGIIIGFAPNNKGNEKDKEYKGGKDDNGNKGNKGNEDHENNKDNKKNMISLPDKYILNTSINNNQYHQYFIFKVYDNATKVHDIFNALKNTYPDHAINFINIVKTQGFYFWDCHVYTYMPFNNWLLNNKEYKYTTYFKL